MNSTSTVRAKPLNHLSAVAFRQFDTPVPSRLSSDFTRRELELDKRSAEFVRKLNETETISYVDSDGFLVRRSPSGVVTRVPGVSRIEQ